MPFLRSTSANSVRIKAEDHKARIQRVNGAYLIESRFEPLLRQLNCSSYAALAQKVKHSDDPVLKSAFIDAITTRETLFFRDSSPFPALQHKIVPELIDAKAGSFRPQRLRIWSAACSSGQEPYSIAMTLRQLIPDVDRWDISILATDISNDAIAQASRGVYSDFEIGRGMPLDWLDEYFIREREVWRIRDEVRGMVSFQRMNLVESFPRIGPFDIIFCRNVAIYFDLRVKRELFERLAKVLEPHGYLFVGSSESLTEFGPRWRPQHHCRAVVYQPNQTQDTGTAAGIAAISSPSPSGSTVD